MSGREREELLSLLKRAQARHGWLSDEVIAELSRSLELPVAEVFGVASFYSFLSTRHRGRHVIRVCASLPCQLKDCQGVIRGVADEIGIGPGEITTDGEFSLELASCIGACDAAPAMLLDDQVHGDLTPSEISRILRSVR